MAAAAALLVLAARLEAVDTTALSSSIEQDGCTMRALAAMFRESIGLAPGREIAAFLVMNDSGLELVRWRADASWRHETFRGMIPAGTVAIVHTHPAEWRHPSRGDVDEARRIGLPVYVVTRAIWVIDPQAGTESQIRGSGWIRPSERTVCDRPDAPPFPPTREPIRTAEE